MSEPLDHFVFWTQDIQKIRQPPFFLLDTPFEFAKPLFAAFRDLLLPSSKREGSTVHHLNDVKRNIIVTIPKDWCEDSKNNNYVLK